MKCCVRVVLLLACLFAFFIPIANGQSYYYKHISVEDGLSGATVYCSAQDSKGYMWFGTETGACRFDGKKFTRFTMDDGLSDNEIFQIREDSDGRIWFLTFNGKPCYYENLKFHNPSNNAVLKKAVAPTNLLLSFYEDSRKNIWIGTMNNGIFKINGSKVTHFAADLADVVDEAISYVIEDASGNIWGISKASMVLIEGDTSSTPQKKPLKRFQNFGRGKDKYCLLLYSDSMLYLMKDPSVSLVPLLRTPVKPQLIHNLYMDASDNIWLSTSNRGCFKYVLVNGTYQLQDELLRNKTVYSVFVDREKNTWITTAGHGIYMLPKDYKNYYSYSIQDGLSEMQINSFAIDKSGNYWLGLGNGNVNVITSTGIKYFKSDPNEEYNNRTTSILVDSQNTVWCAMDRGLLIFKNNIHSTPKRIYNRYTQSLKNVLQNHHTGEIEVTTSGGIVKILKDNSQPIGYRAEADTSLDAQRTFTHAYDHYGNCWLSTMEGLNVYGEKSLKYGPSSSLLRSRMTDIEEFKNEIMVIATYGSGIIFMRDEKIMQQLTSRDELAGNICRGLYVCDSLIWVATNQGLSKVLFDGTKFYVAQNFNSKNGLLSDNVMSVSDNGLMVYAATDRGLSVLNKHAHFTQTEPPLPYITRLQTDDTSFADPSVSEIPSRNRRILFEFIAVTFHNSSEVKYRYRLSGNPNWTETKNNSIEFSSLGPGSYVFELRAKKIDSEWSPLTQVNFTIVPGFWQTWWFRYLILLLIFTVIYSLVHYHYTRKLRKQLAHVREQKAIEAERSRISSDIHDDLGSDLTKITIWSNIIESEQANLDTIIPYNRQISSTANSLLKKMDEIIWTLNPTNDTLPSLASYIRQYSLDYFGTTSINCHVSLDKLPEVTITSSLRRNIFLSVKESLNNILKHSNATTVGLDISSIGDNTVITVVDNGKGFDLANASSDRHGLNNLKMRMAEMGGRVEIKSVNGQGTLLKMIIPQKGIRHAFTKNYRNHTLD
jgi:ligand-binding sensor domain-containing protein